MNASALLCDLGRMGYEETWKLQAALQNRLIQDKRHETPKGLPHVVLVVEHPPVFTLGKSGDVHNLLASGAELLARGASYVETDRGGDITFHGPGQLVVYPILDLDRLETPEGKPMRDLHRFLREMEEAVIRTCADWSVTAGRVDGRTGVWVGPDARGPERKVCAMGVRCSRWVTMHGLALNISTDLNWFDLIVPCGIDDRGVTSLDAETDNVTRSRVQRSLTDHLAERLGLSLHPVSRAHVGGLVGMSENSGASPSP